MKNYPVELLRGSTLKTQIYNSISRNRLAHTTKLLRNTLTTHTHYPSFKSEKAQMKTEVFSPAPKTQTSINKMHKSVNETYHGHKVHGAGHKSKDQLAIKSEKKKGQKSKSQIIVKSRSPQNKSQNGSRKHLGLGLQERKKDKEKEKDKGNSTSKSLKKINLESIIEQSSSDEQLVTPSNKQKTHIKQRSQTPTLVQSRTKKKEKGGELLSQTLKRKIERSFREPEIFQKILKMTQLTVSYRIIKKRLVEIQIYTLKSISRLKVSLDKGNLECQNISEDYHHVSVNTVLALFSSVRNIDLDSLATFPKICIEVECEKGQVEERSVLIPYTWLHFIEDRPPSLKKSKIKTKICLQDLPISKVHLNVLSVIFHAWMKKSLKSHCEFQSSFVLYDQQYSLKLVEQHCERFSLELEGKGEARLTGMIRFLQELIC